MLIEFKVKIELPVGLIFLPFERLEQVLDAVRGECRLAKDTHDLKHGTANLDVMLDDGNEAICDDGNMYLNTNCIFGLTPESFDLEMLLDPFEKELHLPPIFIKKGDLLSLEVEVVRVIYKAAVQFSGIIDDSPNNARVLFSVLLLCEADTLVFEHIVSAIKDTFPIDNLVVRLAFLSDDKEGSEHMNPVETRKIEVPSVKDIACKRLIGEPVHGVNVMHLGIGDSVEHRYLRNNINLCMDSDTRLRASKLCPSEHCHTEVNGCGVNGIEPAVQPKLLCDSSGLGHGHHVEGKLLKDTVVSERIRLGQHLSVDGLSAKTKEYRLLSMGNRNICKLPQASAANKLAEHQYQHVAPMRHRPAFGPVVVLGDYTPELPLRKKLGNLRENVCSYVHLCSDFESDAKVRISRFGQGSVFQKCCA